MKLILVLNILIFNLACVNHNLKNKDNIKNEKDDPKCDVHSLKMNFKEGIKNFKPTGVKLNESLKEDINSFKFLGEVDSICLKSNEDFDNFTIIILIKQYNYHRSHFNQGFDLLMMREGPAKIIIDNFCKLANIDRIEMLNSGYIIEYVKQEGLYNKYKIYIE